MRVACLMMQKDEDLLLGPWLAYHGHLFGYENLFVFDNGSTLRPVLELLGRYEARGVHVERRFATKADYAAKGSIVGSAIRSLEETRMFDMYLPLDCDEFVALRAARGFTVNRSAILEVLSQLVGDHRALRVPHQLANNPFAQDLFTYFDFHKTFFCRGTFDFLDHGYHSGRTIKGGVLETDIIHLHWHFHSFPELRWRALRKWRAPVAPLEARESPDYDGTSMHLIPYFSMSEVEYRSEQMGKVQIYLPQFARLLTSLGEPLVARERSTPFPLEAEQGDDADEGESTQTPMFVPPESDIEAWLKVYFHPGEYLLANGDVKNAGVAALFHFCRFGYREPARVRRLRTKRHSPSIGVSDAPDRSSSEKAP